MSPNPERSALSTLDSEGIVLDVDFDGTSCLRYTFDLEDLGVDLPPSAQGLIEQPVAYTIPKRWAMRLLAAGQEGREALYRWGMRQGAVDDYFGTGWRWVPWTAQARFEERFAWAERRLEAVKADIEASRASIRDEVEVALGEVADRSIKSLSAVRATGVPFDLKERIVKTGLERIPTSEQIAAIRLRYRTPAAASIAEFQRRAASTPNLAASLPQTPEEIKAWAEAEVARQEVETKRQMAQAERAAKIRAVEMKLEAARELARSEFDPIREAIAHVRGEIYDAARDLLGTIEKRGFLPGSSAEKVANLTDWFRAFNVGGDEDLAKLISDLSAFAAKPAKGEKRSVEALAATLSQITALTEEATREAASTTRFSRMIVRKRSSNAAPDGASESTGE